MSDSSPHAGAPEEVKITPEMIEAGVAVLVRRYDMFGDFIERKAVEEIFRVMLEVDISCAAGAYVRAKLRSANAAS